MIGWVLNLAYLIAVALALPLLVWRSATSGRYRDGWREKFLGRLPRFAAGNNVVWLHAVSVGEVLQLKPIVSRLRSQRPQCTLLVTTTTRTGYAVAREQLPNCRVAYAPLDFTWAVRSALRRVRPQWVILVELELWPNLILQTARAGIPLALINGRISERSHRGYQRIRPLMKHLLCRFRVLAVQSQAYRERLLDLGAPPDRLYVTGSVKYDGISDTADLDAADHLRRQLGISTAECVLVAGSTHSPEELHALTTYEILRAEFQNLRLIIVPRHKERFDEVARLVRSRGFPLLRRTATTGGTSAESRIGSSLEQKEPAVILLDTLGELSLVWHLASVAFVGGSLTRRGGQNMIEPAAAGVAVIVGPNTGNFRDVVEGLASRGGIRVARNDVDLTQRVRECLRDPETAQTQGAAARRFVLSQRGAADRTIQLLLTLDESVTSSSVRSAA